MPRQFPFARASLAALALLTSGIALDPAAAGTLDDIKARGHMVVAIDPTFSPYEFTTADGVITGYDPELLQAIAKDMGVTVDFQKMSFDGIIPGLSRARSTSPRRRSTSRPNAPSASATRSRSPRHRTSSSPPSADRSRRPTPRPSPATPPP